MIKKPRTAIDTGVLITMAEGELRSVEACRKLSNIGHSLLVPSTVMQECELLCNSSKLSYRKIGEEIVSNLVSRWAIIPAPASSSVDHGIALQNLRD